MSSACSLLLFDMEESTVGSPPAPSLWRRKGCVSSENKLSESNSEYRNAGHYDFDEGKIICASVSSAELPLGTSAPIDIKFVSPGQKRRTLEVKQQFSRSFVPPHLLNSQWNLEWLLVEQGLSPTAALKKEKLKVRDAVLRSTGYQE